jgi:RND family efflux transporter MFP subunit
MNFNGPFKVEHATETDRENETTKPESEKRRRGGRPAAFGLALVAVAALALGAWSHYAERRQTLATAEQERDFVPQVRVASVEPSSNIEVVSLPATTSAFASANIFARASGYIGAREVDIGDHVKQGQLLAEIVAPELDHQIAQAEATLAQLNSALQQAQANRTLAQVTWDRDRPLVDKGWVTAQQGTIDEQTLKAQEAAVSVAQANVKAEEAQLQVLRQQKLYQRVVAPFDGVITQRNIDVGSLVQADAASGTFLFALAHADVIRIQLYVPQDDAIGVVPGTQAVVRVPEIPGRDFSGSVTRIADALQPGTRTLLAEIDVPNPDHALSPGMYCRVELKIPRKTPSLIVPSEAIIFNRNGLSVAVVENDTARIRNVTVVRDFGTSVEVSEGVAAGDKVIMNPQVDLADGRKVTIRPDPPKPDQTKKS